MAVTRIVPGAQKSQIYRVRGQRSRWRYPHESLGPEYCEVLSNINLSERGTAESRYGYASYNSGAAALGEAVVGLWEGAFSSGTTRRVVVTVDHVYEDDGTTRTDITGAHLAGGSDDRCRFVFLKDQLILNNGVDEPRTWDGDLTHTTADLTGIPFSAARDIITHQNLLLAFGTTEGGVFYPTRVRWCDINRSTFVVDITNWPSANRYEVYDGGPEIVGAVDNWGYALTFKADGLYPGQIVYDTLGRYEFRLGTPSRGFHPVSKMSIIARPEFVFCAAREGLVIVSSDLSTKIVNTDDVNTWLELNQARLKYCQAFVREADHQVRLLCSSSTNSSGFDRVLVWDWDTNDVWWDTPGATMNFGWYVSASSVYYDWFGALSGGLYKGNDSTASSDDGASITWRIMMCQNDLGLPGFSKHILNVKTYYRYKAGGGTVSFQANLDAGLQAPVSGSLSLDTPNLWDSGVLWDSGLTWESSEIRVQDFFINRICSTIAPEWYSSNPGSIEGYQVEFVVLEGQGE